MKSKSISLLFFLHLIRQVCLISKFEITYTKENNKYSLLTKLGSEQSSIILVIDTSIPLSLINSPKCKVCTNSNTYVYDPSKSKDSQLVAPESTYHKGKYDYKGSSYTDSLALTTFDSASKFFKSTVNFLSVAEISLLTKVTENGILSLSYYSQVFKQISEKPIFVLECSSSSGKITLGGINDKIINTTQLVYFPIKTNDKEQRWYLEPNGLTIFNKTNSFPFKESQRILIDSTTWQVHIPKKFFIDNAKVILSSKCQVQPSGQFFCMCSTDVQSVFPTFNFTFDNGFLLVKPSDYITLDSSTGYCVIYININYANDYWSLGINVLNNFFTIFDYEKKQMAFFPKENAKGNSSYFIMILISVGLSSIVILFGGFWIYKKCIANRSDAHEAHPEPERVEEEDDGE